MHDQVEEHCLRRSDYGWLGLFCLIFFGFSLIGGRGLSMHEGVLPQTAREMFVDHDWAIPKNGGRPWLESPPLPQWVTVAVASVFGRCDEIWIVRIPPALMGTLSVLLLAGIAARWYGRMMGLVSGLVLATLYEFTQYAWLAEDEIFLCALVTATIAQFAWLEFGGNAPRLDGGEGETELPQSGGEWYSFFGKRTWGVLAFFVLLGMTNLAKGLAFGTVMALAPIGGFLLWNGDLQRLSRYVWFWGWLAFLLVACAWPLAAYWRYPDVTELWFYDLGGRMDGTYTEINRPVWYYLKVLPLNLAPWTLVVPVGFWLTARGMRTKYSPERFLWCWALLPLIVLSIPNGKHHHYLLHSMAPWAVLAATALVWIRPRLALAPRYTSPIQNLFVIALPGMVALWLLRARVPGPEWIVPLMIVGLPCVVFVVSWGLVHPRPRVAAVTLFGALTLGFLLGHLYAGLGFDKSRFDNAFLKQVRERIGPDQQLLVNTQMASLDEFRILFYLDERVIPLHNLTFLRDDRILSDDVFVIARQSARHELQTYGTVEQVLQSERTRRERSPDDRLTLFRLRYFPNIARLSTRGLRITPMQTMGRAGGPYLDSPRGPMNAASPIGTKQVQISHDERQPISSAGGPR